MVAGIIDRIVAVADPAYVQAAADVPVPSKIRKLLSKAGITPAPAGKQLAVAYVDAQLAKAGLTMEERLLVKSSLATAKQLAPHAR